MTGWRGFDSHASYKDKKNYGIIGALRPLLFLILPTKKDKMFGG